MHNYTTFKRHPNYFPLWDRWRYALEALQGSTEKADPTLGSAVDPEQIKARAKELESWVGWSLAAEMEPDANSQTRADYLDPFYQGGERSDEFLIEYTGALGMAGRFEEVPALVWQQEKAVGSRKWLRAE